MMLDDPRDDPRRDEFPPISDNLSSHSVIVRTTANGALDLRVQDDNVAPQLVNQAVVAIRLATEASALEAKSRVIRNIMVPAVLAVAAFAFMALRPRS
jgi:hypothetical protein